MGVAFAFFSGFYFWFWKITGYAYDECLGLVHFIITFIGVNLTFLPMHFLGLNGMPRRIADYPDVFYFWNKVSSYGSFLSFVGLIHFIILIGGAFIYYNYDEMWEFIDKNVKRIPYYSLVEELSEHLENKFIQLGKGLEEWQERRLNRENRVVKLIKDVWEKIEQRRRERDKDDEDIPKTKWQRKY
jgi:heme/copper-type cytochrome/quinol oxidase subunit 1